MENLDSNTIYTIGLPIAFGLILLEALFSAWKNKGYYHRGDSLGTLGLFIGNTIMVVVNFATWQHRNLNYQSFRS